MCIRDSVTLAWAPILFPNLGNYSSLRAFRALRPLRALRRVPGMPVLVSSILDVMPKMGNVLMLCGFVFLVFGIVGMELFKGALHYRCARPGFEETRGHPMPARRLEEVAAAALARRALRGGGGRSEAAGAHSGQALYDTDVSCNPLHDDAEQCPPGTSCAYFDVNPGHGITSFDSVGFVFLSYIQAVTFDDWATSMYALMDAFSELVWVYFILIIMVAGFFVVNLFLAVIFMEYGEAQEALKDELAKTARGTARTCLLYTSPSPRD